MLESLKFWKTKKEPLILNSDEEVFIENSGKIISLAEILKNAELSEKRYDIGGKQISADEMYEEYKKLINSIKKIIT